MARGSLISVSRVLCTTLVEDGYADAEGELFVAIELYLRAYADNEAIYAWNMMMAPEREIRNGAVNRASALLDRWTEQAESKKATSSDPDPIVASAVLVALCLLIIILYHGFK